MRTLFGTALLGLVVGLPVGKWVPIPDIAVIAIVAVGAVMGYLLLLTGSPNRD